MARQVLPWVGAAVGAYFGNPQLGFAIGSIIGNAVDPQRLQGPKLGEAQTQTAREGVYCPVVLGVGCVAGNIMNRGPRIVRIHRERQGKGGGPVVETERGYRTFAIRIAEPPNSSGYTLLRIWENEKLVYDVRPESEIPAETAEYASRFRFYAGTEDQLPDPALEAYMGAGNVSAYRGRAYIVFQDFDLTDYRDAIPQFRFEVASEGVVGSTVLLARKRGISVDVMTMTADWQTGGWVEKGFATDFSVDLTQLDDERVLLTSGGAGGRFTDDHGQTFQLSGGSSFGSFSCRPFHLDGLIGTISPASGHKSRRSTNNADSFENPNTGPDAYMVLPLMVGGDIRCVAYGTGRLYVSNDRMLSWGGEILIWPEIGFLNTTVHGSWSNGVTAMFGGLDGVTQYPKIISTTTGLSVAEENLPTLSSPEYITCLTEHDNVWVAGTDLGNILYRDTEGVWHVADAVLGADTYARDATHNGSEFLMIGNSSTTGVIKSSVDGKSWTTRYTASASGTQPWWAIAPINQPSIGDRISLSSIVQWCHDRVYQPSSDYDVSELTDLVDGIVFADGYTARDAITASLTPYFCDAFEGDRGSGYRINYVKRGANAVRTLTFDDLVDEPEEAIREDALERPKVLHLHYQSPVIGYAPAKASIMRLSPDAKVSGEIAVQTPITFNDQTEPWVVADRMMREAWTGVSGERKFSVSDAHLDLTPTDVVTLSLRGTVTRLRITKTELADGVLNIEALVDRQSNYTLNYAAPVPVLPAPERPPDGIAGPTVMAILDIPAIADSDDRLGYYVAATGTRDGWGGAAIQRDTGSGFGTITTFDRSSRSVIGVLQDTVTAASPHYTDTTNTVSVQLYMDDELESLTEQQFLSEGGAFALEWEDSGTTRWEVMQYRDAEQDSDGIWHLTHLARGRLNTEASEHLAGARFVLLDRVQFIDAPVALLGEDITHRAVSMGTSPETAAPETITFTGQTQTEWEVASIEGGIVGDDLSITIIPRHRFGTEVHPVRSANWDGYRIEVTDGTNTINLDSTAASHTFDVTGWASPVAVTVSQLNRITGAGPEITEQF